MLRKSPTRTEAFLAANRRNAQKCTGPRTPEGKARGPLNGLKNGRYAEQLPEKLEAAGYHSAAALYSQIRSETTVAFNVEKGSVGAKQVERVTAQVWCLAWRTGVLGPKPESPLFRKDSRRLSRARLLFRIKDPRLRIGMVYWVQRKRYWTAKRWIQDVLNGVPSPVPTVAQALGKQAAQAGVPAGATGFRGAGAVRAGPERLPGPARAAQPRLTAPAREALLRPVVGGEGKE